MVLERNKILVSMVNELSVKCGPILCAATLDLSRLVSIPAGMALILPMNFTGIIKLNNLICDDRIAYPISDKYEIELLSYNPNL